MKKKIKDCTIREILEHRYNQRIQPLICLVQSLLYLNCNTSYFKEFSMNDYFENWIKPCIKDEILEIEVEEYEYNYAEKYIKKQVVVEAFHYRRYCTDYRDLEKFCGNSLMGLDKNYAPIIKTLEGEVSLYDDCYVIKGIQGEFYPCKPDIFQETYEKVEE